MNEDQFNDSIKGTVEQRDCSVRQVNNGFRLEGVRRFIDPVSKGARVAQQMEAVATLATDAASLTAKFLDTGSFE